MEKNQWHLISRISFVGVVISLVAFIALIFLITTMFSIGGCFPSEYPLSEKNTPECFQVTQHPCTGRINVVNLCEETFLLSQKGINIDKFFEDPNQLEHQSDDYYIFLPQGQITEIYPYMLIIDSSNKEKPWVLEISKSDLSETYSISGKTNQELIEKRTFENFIGNNLLIWFITCFISIIILSIIAFISRNKYNKRH